jgi:hypothetical protein
MAPHVKEEHRMRADSFHDSDEKMWLNIGLYIDQMIAFRVAGREWEEIKLLALHDKRQSAEDIVEHTDDSYEKRA